ncbi:MAG: HEAT repeat domain-containing protein [Planctomycetota bacterium]|nr:HEAT repeat domain-containing protein [Planctomycetota bacterium]
MNRISWLISGALGLVLFAAPCRADTVFLKDGTEIPGEIVEESPAAVVIKDGRTGRLRSIRRENIDLVVRDKPKTDNSSLFGLGTGLRTRVKPVVKDEDEPKEGEAAEGEKKEGEGEVKAPDGEKKPGEGETAEGEKKEGESAEGEKKPGEAEKTAEGAGAPDEKKDAFAVPEKHQAAFKKGLELLGSQNPTERAKGKSDLQALGKEIIPGLIPVLLHKDPEARACAADLLSEFNAKNSIKFLVEALYGIMPDKGEAATWNRGNVRSLKDALSRTTGQSFINVEPRSPLVQDGLQKYVKWYNENFDRLPSQVGEPEIDPTDKDYFAKLKEARSLKLEKRSFPRPALSADIATGQKPGTPPPTEGYKTVEKEFKENFPTATRENAAGVIREKDKETAKDFFDNP